MEYKKHERQKDGDNVQANDEANAISPVPQCSTASVSYG
jgi:hypothetical protein